MGKNISKSLSPPPLSLRDCVVNGRIDLTRYLFITRQLDLQQKEFDSFFKSIQAKERKFDDFHVEITTKVRHKRLTKRHKLYARMSNGKIRELMPEDTIWYFLYVSSPPRNERMMVLFRNRFRIPYSYFIDLVVELMKHDLFQRWICNDACGVSPSNFKLLLLGSLRYLGRSWTFDDVSEANGISREVNRMFFLSFIEYGASVLYTKHVIESAKLLNPKSIQHLFEAAGFNGCMGSLDATHISLLNLSSWANMSHKDFKLNLPTRSFNLTVTHTKQILASTTGHPSTWNDKTIVLFDSLIAGVNDGELFQESTFSLFERNLDGEINEIKYRGVWFMVDNGYLKWSCTIPPVKDADTIQAIRFACEKISNAHLEF